MTSRVFHVKIFLQAICVLLLGGTALHAAQSSIVVASGYACMGDDKSRKQTEDIAVADAKRKAAESALTYIKTETSVKNYAIEKDLVDAYASASVRILNELEKGWYRDDTLGECYRVKVKAEVIPDEKAVSVSQNPKAQGFIDDPLAPLTVRLWTDKKEYGQGQDVKVYIKGNKPFYARIIYKDAGGNVIQLLPNPFRSDNYFNGGVVYEVPSGNDRFTLEVTPPFGSEEVTLYASSAPLGELALKPVAGVYEVLTESKDIGARTRGVKILEKTAGGKAQASEFVEEKSAVKTEKR
ncbi:MAG: DUF4384 domain-containing protein [Deltaproteobacteria bacterium]|nr:DUF4384 domain-containing protein [Deltaproteobacteria bacterium]